MSAKDKKNNNINCFIILVGVVNFIILMIVFAYSGVFSAREININALSYRGEEIDNDFDTEMYNTILYSNKNNVSFKYKKLSYISMNGEQYLHLYFKPTSNSEADIRFECTDIKGEQIILKRDNYKARFGLYLKENKLYCDFGRKETINCHWFIEKNKIYEVKYGKDVIINRNKTITTTAEFIISHKGDLQLFHDNSKYMKEITDNGLIGKIYHLYLYDDGVLKRFMVPIELEEDIGIEKSADGKEHRKGEKGLLDLLGGKFFQSIGPKQFE